MKRSKWIWILSAEAIVLLALLAVMLLPGGKPGAETSVPTTEPPTVSTTAAPTTEAATLPPTTQAPTIETTVPPTTEPQPEIFHLTFAGDCTLGTLYEYYSLASCFPAVVGEDYGYPFASVQEWFAGDDFTMVNLEGPLTNEGTPEIKSYTMRGDPKLANILPAGSVEFVSIANNHTLDFGYVGYENTKAALDGVGVGYAGEQETALVETPRGLKLGILCIAFYMDMEDMTQAIADLRAQGAEIVIVSFHWGVELVYRHTATQEEYAHTAIDAGADIIYGHHPHVLQEIEEYNGGIIYYSLGNFSFGGNNCPSDFDTVLISQQVIREVDGTVHLGACTPVPCSISANPQYNDFQPTPLEPGSDRYDRVLDKLSGAYIPPAPPPEEETTEETTQAPAGDTTGEATQPPEEGNEDTSQPPQEGGGETSDPTSDPEPEI